MIMWDRNRLMYKESVQYLYTKENSRIWREVYVSIFDEFVIPSEMVLVNQNVSTKHTISFTKA